MPRVSVLLPVRDAAPHLGACLDSLAAQTLCDHEVIAVDDGSRDGSSELLLSRAASDPRLRVRCTPPRGLVPALALALAEARAPLVARMDADDVARPLRLALQAARLESDPGVDVLGCRVVATAGSGARPGPGMARYVEWSNGLLEHEAISRARFVESPLVHPSVAMRTLTLRRLGGWRDFDGPEDYELWLRALSAGLRFAKLDQVLLEWRDTPQRLTRRDPRYRPSRFLAVKLAALAELLQGRAVVVWGAGPIGKAWARSLVSRGHRLQAIVEVDPRKIGQRIHGAPVVPVEQAGVLADAVHLGAVGQPGARQRLRSVAAAAGLVDGETFFAVA